jgi:tripartite-type tricarboxylate transporter receptor subunit TctC
MGKLLACFCLALGFVLPVSQAAAQQPYPNRPVRIVAPFPPGQGTDLIARLVAQHLGTALGQNFFVDNKPGAAGIVGAQFVKNAAPDGYTLLVAGGGPLAINASLYSKLPYDPLKDFEPVAMVAAVPNILVVRADFPANTLQELVAYIRARPGQLNYGSSGAGVPGHLITEMFKAAANLQVNHVPYAGAGPAMTALMTGDIAMLFETAASAMPQVRAGKLKVIANAAGKRSAALPDVPTIAESGYPSFAAQGWSAVVAPAGTPPEIVKRLNTEVATILKRPDVRERLISLSTDPVEMTVEETGAYMKGQVALWAQAVKLSGARAD